MMHTAEFRTTVKYFYSVVFAFTHVRLIVLLTICAVLFMTTYKISF